MIPLSFLLCALFLLRPPGGALDQGPRFPVKATHDLVYGSAPVRAPIPSGKPLFLDLYQPDPGDPSRVYPGLVAVHGGGLVRGDKRTDNMVELCRELAASGYVCVSINYRLRGDDPPVSALAAAIEDAGQAVQWLRSNAARYQVDPLRIAAGGSSAGAAVVLRLGYGRTAATAKLGAVLSWVGGLDGQEDILDAGDPPLFIVHGADDDAVPVAEAYALAARARQVALPHQIHVCEALGHNVPLDRRPGGVSLYRRLTDFLFEQMDVAHAGQPFQRAPVPPSQPGSPKPAPCPR